MFLLEPLALWVANYATTLFFYELPDEKIHQVLSKKN